MSTYVRQLPRDDVAYYMGSSYDESNSRYPWEWIADTDGVPDAIQIADFEGGSWTNPGPVMYQVGWSKRHHAWIYVAQDGSIFRMLGD